MLEETRVLIVDDDECMREFLVDGLELAGMIVESACDGEEAMRLIDEKPVDVVLTDLVMPGREGIETIQELKRTYPKVSIVAMSGAGFGDKYLTVARQLGAQQTLEKPFSIQAALLAIEAAITAAPSR
jgi:DNA-binding NtrC family response regulator